MGYLTKMIEKSGQNGLFHSRFSILGQLTRPLFRVACYIIPSAHKNTHFQRASFREERRCRTLKEMTIPAVLRLALHDNTPTQNGHS